MSTELRCARCDNVKTLHSLYDWIIVSLGHNVYGLCGRKFFSPCRRRRR
jgi:hypothetical protein